MGFIAKDIYVVAGSTDFPVGTDYSLQLQRSKYLLTRCAQALIACNVGWQLDTSRNATDTSYTDIPCEGGNYVYPGLFFRNTISGCKLFMAYFGSNPLYNPIKKYPNSVFVCNGWNNHSGLCLSMIPDGSTSEFGDPTSSTFIPSDATQIFGTFPINSNYQNPKVAGADPGNGYSYAYWILATPYCIAVYPNHNENGITPIGIYCPTFACGRIFGFISHPKTTNNARYGVISFRNCPSQYESWVSVNNTDVTVFGSAFYIAEYIDSNRPIASVSKSDGSWLGYESGVGCTVMTTVDRYRLSLTKTYQDQNSFRWSPIAVSARTFYDDSPSYSIYNGDGFKGYLDTELFVSVANKPRGVYASGKYCIPEENVGYMIGWDASNNINGGNMD